jgi:2'-5' RNA ligase
MDTLRTFIALALPSAVRTQACQLQQRLMAHCLGVRWVNPDHMHLTLKFLGATRPDQVSSIAGVLAETAQGCAPFALDLAGVGAFPNTRNPKVLWVGVRFDAALSDFCKQLETALEPLGFPQEKRTFSPHLTLGRVKDGTHRKELADCIERYSRERIGSVEASRIVFFKSDLTPSGPVYSVLDEVVLLKRQ